MYFWQEIPASATLEPILDCTNSCKLSLLLLSSSLDSIIIARFPLCSAPPLVSLFLASLARNSGFVHSGAVIMAGADAIELESHRLIEYSVQGGNWWFGYAGKNVISIV